MVYCSLLRFHQITINSLMVESTMEHMCVCMCVCVCVRERERERERDRERERERQASLLSF
jgi:hypothetical protein